MTPVRDFEISRYRAHAPQARALRKPPTQLFEQVVAYVSNDLPNFQRFLFDQFRPLESLWTKVLELHKLGICENHAHAVIQVV